VQVQMFDKCTT